MTFLFLILSKAFSEITIIKSTSRTLLERNLKAYKEAFSNEGLLYAVKVNNNLALMKIIASHGFGADVIREKGSYGDLIEKQSLPE